LLVKEQLLDKISQIDGDYNREELKDTLTQIFQGMKDITTGFLKIARAVEIIKEKKYYKEMGYSTFSMFCKEVLGLTRKTVYLYLRIDEILSKYPHLFDESFITRIGSAKMDKIIAGINKIENSTISKVKKNKKILQLVSSIDTNMSVGEIESIVIQKTK